MKKTIETLKGLQLQVKLIKSLGCILSLKMLQKMSFSRKIAKHLRAIGEEPKLIHKKSAE
ncbi:hypothetical protein [Methanohalophilus sp.]|uniref:hypothetical protein n=1 Tax=Methanohalophilus sp. TaxID=1966352 RepID=UPI00262AD694|nr:hypothetical protein [Methanohalophilus sp.]